MVIPALKMGGYQTQTQVSVGRRPGGGAHRVDVVARDNAGVGYLVSMKWQQVSGTAEQKVPYEVICLADAVRDPANDFTVAYLVLGGDGWSLREFFVSGGLSEHLVHASKVKVVTLETFIALANKGQL